MGYVSELGETAGQEERRRTRTKEAVDAMREAAFPEHLCQQLADAFQHDDVEKMQETIAWAQRHARTFEMAKARDALGLLWAATRW